MSLPSAREGHPLPQSGGFDWTCSLGRAPRLLLVATVPVTLRSFLFPYARHFRGLGWRVDGAAARVSDCPASAQEFDRIVDIPWSRNAWRPSNLLLAPGALRRAVAQGDYDLVHATTPVAAFVMRYALRRRRRQGRPRLIYTAQGFHFHRQNSSAANIAFRSLERLAGRWTDYLVVVNREDHASAQHLRLVPKDRLFYMPGIGIDLNQYSAARVSEAQTAALRRELALEPNQPLFLMVAELSRRKRPGDAITAFHQLARPEARLALVGDGPLQAWSAQQIRQCGLEGRVLLLGRRTDIPVLMRAAVATVLTSRQEGLPRVVKESMALETPVIGTRIRGTEELLEDGCGLLFDVGDVDQLTRHMASVLDHPDTAREMAARARARIEGYDERLIVRLHEDLYVRALREVTPSLRS